MKWLINGVLILLLGYLLVVNIVLFPPHPIKTRGTLKIPGLRNEVTIERDSNGLATIKASNAHDLFFAQGFVHCQERFFQMDILRRLAQGKLAEIFGKTALKLDEGSRRFGLNRFKWTPNGEEKAILEAYRDGVNACLNLTGSSFEYKILMLKREPWTLKDTISVARFLQWGLSSNFTEELVRYEILSRKKELAKYWNVLDPISSPQSPYIIPEGTPILKAGEGILDFLSIFQKGMSNNWVISGKRTSTGRPILANDPHLTISIPGIWYLIHLKGGEYDVRGVSLPGSPGVVIGRNERIAWGMTNSFADVQDLYIVRINGDKYIVNGKEKPLRKRIERIKIKGGGEKTITFLETEYGPVIFSKGDMGIALRWTGYDIGHLVYSLILLNRAKNWDEFRKALEFWTVPSQNIVYADVDGNIGYQLSGLIPKKSWSGLFPVKSGKWEGFYTPEELPHWLNPERGFIVTANNRVKPDFKGVYDVCPGYRAWRIEQLIQSKEKITIEDVMKIQQDKKSLYAERFIKAALPVLKKFFPQDRWVNSFKKWDFKITHDSPEAALYELLVIETQKKLFFPDNKEIQRLYLGKLPDERGFSLFTLKSREALVNIIENNRNDIVKAVSGGKYSNVEDVIKDGFISAKSIAAEKPWGEFHYLELIHPLAQNAFLRRLFGNKLLPGKFPMGGDKETVVQANFDIFKLGRVTVAPSMREIIDFKDEYWISVPGQSGIPSAHYRDLIRKWLKGEYIKFSTGTKEILKLHP